MTELLEQILEDLQRLRVAYERRGLLGSSMALPSSSSPAGSAPHVVPGKSGTAPSPLARELLLADGLLRNLVGRSGAPDHAAVQRNSENPGPVDPAAKSFFQVAVFGGTQVGKSTVMNVLAGRALARVHHTAGFTRHAQGFSPPSISPETALASYPRCFPGFVRVPQMSLSQERPLEYSLEQLQQPALLTQSVLWDAPDCDAVNSSVFQQGFVEAITLADVVVYVTSREKYAVNGILEWVVRLKKAGIAVVSVLNMTPRPQQPELIADMGEALSRVAGADGDDSSDPARQENSGLSRPSQLDAQPIVAFEYVADGDVSLLYDSSYAPADQLRNTVARLAADAVPQLKSRQINALYWIEEAMPRILEPALHDFDAWQQWNDRVEVVLEQFVDDYRRFYLDDPQRYDAFNRVGLEILELLNPPVPGLKKTLTAVRTIVSLPARALLAGGKAVYRYASSGGRSFTKESLVSHETATYRDAHDRLLNELSRTIEQRRRSHGGGSHNFWQALDQGWIAHVPQIEKEFQQALETHRARIDQWTREAAQAIYQELARDPVKLNVLRTSRIAADAGAIVVSIKTGGPGDIVHDLVVAPALMSLVEAATRQIAGSYVEQKKEELRQRLIHDTRSFAEEVYGKTVGRLSAEALDKIGLDSAHAEDIRQLPQRVGFLRKEMQV